MGNARSLISACHVPAADLGAMPLDVAVSHSLAGLGEVGVDGEGLRPAPTLVIEVDDRIGCRQGRLDHRRAAELCALPLVLGGLLRLAHMVGDRSAFWGGTRRTALFPTSRTW